MAFNNYFEMFVLIVATIVLCCESAEEKVKIAGVDRTRYRIPAVDSRIRPKECYPGFYGDACEHMEEWKEKELIEKYKNL